MKNNKARKNQSKKAGGAFTLIELLVCLVILGLLASLFLSFLNGAVIQAKNVRCLSNLRQLNTLIIDNDWAVLDCPLNKLSPSYWAFFKSKTELGCIAEFDYVHRGEMQIMMKSGEIRKLKPNRFDAPPTFLTVE